MSSDLLHIRVHPTSPPFYPMLVKMLSAVVFSLAFAAVLGQDEGIRHQVKQGGGGVHVVEGVRCF